MIRVTVFQSVCNYSRITADTLKENQIQNKRAEMIATKKRQRTKGDDGEREEATGRHARGFWWCDKTLA